MRTDNKKDYIQKIERNKDEIARKNKKIQEDKKKKRGQG
jgi:hypothetical protein